MIDDGICEHCNGIRALRGDDMGCNCHFCLECHEWPAETWADYCQECINGMEDEEFAQRVLHVGGRAADTERRQG